MVWVCEPIRMQIDNSRVWPSNILNILVFLNQFDPNVLKYSRNKGKIIHRKFLWPRDIRNSISPVPLWKELLFVVSEYSGTQNPMKAWVDHVPMLLFTKAHLRYKGSYFYGVSITAVLELRVWGIFSIICMWFHKGWVSLLNCNKISNFLHNI